MKRKVLFISVMFCLLFAAAASFTACGFCGTSGGVSSGGGASLNGGEIGAIYTAYAESGGTLSYEEWLASIKGEDGVGISKIEKTGTAGLVDTYTITLTNGQTSTFTVTNGKDGASSETSDPDAPTPDSYFRFTLRDDETYEISARYKDMPSRVVIPSTYNGKPVTEIAARGFKNRGSMDEVFIPKTIKCIKDYAFSENEKWFSSVVFEEGSQLARIEANAFNYCRGLTTIEIPDSVTSIGDGAFSGCSCLISATIGSGVSSLGDYVFSGCNKLMEIYNKSSVLIAAGKYGGMGYPTYPLNVYTMEGGSKLSAEDGYILYTDGDEKILVGYSGDRSGLPFPSDITEIYRYAFYECTGLISVTIPSSVTNIGDYAFGSCTGLTDIIFQGNKDAWNAVSKSGSWDYYAGDYTIHCTDGDIEK